MLEYVARVLLRRERKNNFIFLTSRFDSMEEIIQKYRIFVPEEFKEQVELFRQEWNRCDIIEFVFRDKTARVIKEIIIYDVKSKLHQVKRNYFEVCESGNKFFKECKKLKIPSFIISIIILKDWVISFNIYAIKDVLLRQYSNFKNN
jgi:hypothetical protein